MVVATLLAAGSEVGAIYDDDPQTHGNTILGVPVLGTISEAIAARPDVVMIGIGENRDRKRLSLESALVFTRAIHPSALVGPEVLVRDGVVVFAGAVIQPRSLIREHAIVNTGCVIDHDCRVGPYALVGSGATLAGGVEVGEGVLIGAGATVSPGVAIGDWSIVGAGAAVIADVPPRETVVGVPAKPIGGA
jgi:UDP-perosamine 4-acetyltransferase